MDRSRGWSLVMIVGTAVIAVSLLDAWHAMRDPVPSLSEQDRRALYESNMRNFVETCEGRGGVEANPGLREFCRRQAQLLRLLSDCQADCQRRTASFTLPDPTK